MKEYPKHPSLFIDETSCGRIRGAAGEAERLQRLHSDQLQIIYEHKWFKIFIPRRFGGIGLNLPEALRLEEALSWTDGSTGWVVTLCAGAGWFAGFLPPELLDEIISNDNLCIAGSGAVTGTANRTEAGYEVSGSWRYASGSLHATVFSANCSIMKDGAAQLDETGSPVVRTFLFHKDEVIVRQDWHCMGMIATASHSFEVKSLLVPHHRCFTIDARHAVLNEPVYQYPFLQFAEVTLAINVSGMAMRFIDLCQHLFAERMARIKSGTPDLYQLLAGARHKMNYHRHDFYESIDTSWAVCARRELLSEEMLRNVHNSSHALARISLQVVDELYPRCGLVAADIRTEINRVWRNIHTASQHALFSLD